jgi:hypothetical protein
VIPVKVGDPNACAESASPTPSSPATIATETKHTPTRTPRRFPTWTTPDAPLDQRNAA